MTIESAIYIRGRKMPAELWEKRKAQLMLIFEENERKLKEMEDEEYGATAAGAN
ncbi:hypothetical protein [Salibacterium sp. K-3]